MATVYSLICFGGRSGKTVTFTDAGDVVNLTNHGLRPGTGVVFSTTGTLPTGLTAATTYYAKQGADANKFLLYPTSADAIAGTNQITFTGTGTGTHTVKSAYFLALTSDELLRYGTAGSERIYDGLTAWVSGRAGSNAADTEICEIGMDFIDNFGAGTLSVTLPAASFDVYPINSSGHAGIVGAGYAVKSSNTSVSTAVLRINSRGTMRGFSVECTGGGSGVSVDYPNSVTDRLICLGTVGTTNFGIRNGASATVVQNNLVYGWKYGTNVLNALKGAVLSGNTFTKNDIGVFTAFTTNVNGYYWNNLSVGNTTSNWSAEPTGIEGAGGNSGLSTDPTWATGSFSTVTVATTDFVDYTNNNFRPALSSSPQVDSGVSHFGISAVDISSDERPNYNNGGAEAIDSGCYEFDHGFGPHPTADYRGLTFTGLISGSTLKVFETGTTTELFSDTSTATTETWSENATGSKTVDYTVLKDGYVPIRVTSITVTGAVSGGVLTTPIQQKESRAYAASSGLTYGTTATITTGTKEFATTVATTIQNFYSFCCEAWRAQTALKNVAFPLVENGPNSFQLSDGWVFTSGSIQYLSRDGMRTVNSSNAVTGVWAAVLSVGVPTGMQVRYQQQDGSGTTNAANTGNMDQLVKVMSDPNGDGLFGDGFDYRGHLVLKVQADGYDQAEFDLVGTFGTLEDQFYVAGLTPVANGIGAAAITGVTITDHGATPVTWNSKVFSITITDTTSHTGDQILQYVRGLNNFNHHDLVQTNGTEFKTVRGKLYGDTGATLKGVRVVQVDGTTSHADFNLHTADDGTTYIPPLPPAAATATILANSRVQLYNVTTATEIENVFVTGTSYSFIITTQASAGHTLRLRVCKLGKMAAESFAVWSASGAAFIVSQMEDTVYTAWGIDGSTVTEFALDGPNLQIDANDVDGATTKTRLGAFYNYALTTELGIRSFYGAVTFLSTAAIRVNTSVTNLFIDNTNPTTALRFTDLDVRLYKSDGTSIIAPTSYSIHNDYSGVPDVVETGVSGLTGAESAQLMGLTNAPSAASNASAVLAAAAVTPIVADIKRVYGQTLTGTGTELDPWRPV